MDALDLRLLRTMGMDPWGGEPPDPRALSPSVLADATGVTTETVRQRIAKMEDAGVIRGYQAYPDAGQLDLDVTLLRARLPDDGQVGDVIDQLGLIDGILEIHDLVGGALTISLAHRDDGERERRVELVGRTVDDASPVRLATRTRDPGQARMGPLDWRIVRALRGHADRSLAEVAEEVGVSYRTVKRRRDRMVDTGALVIAPLVDVSRIEGVLPVDLFVQLEEGADDETINAVLDLFPEQQLQRYVPEEGDRWFVDLLVSASTLAKAEAMRQRASRIEGVRRASTVLTRASYETTWLDACIDRRIDALF